jgi:hypothetical protein
MTEANAELSFSKHSEKNVSAALTQRFPSFSPLEIFRWLSSKNNLFP